MTESSVNERDFAPILPPAPDEDPLRASRGVAHAPDEEEDALESEPLLADED